MLLQRNKTHALPKSKPFKKFTEEPLTNKITFRDKVVMNFAPLGEAVGIPSNSLLQISNSFKYYLIT